MNFSTWWISLLHFIMYAACAMYLCQTVMRWLKRDDEKKVVQYKNMAVYHVPVKEFVIRDRDGAYVLTEGCGHSDFRSSDNADQKMLRRLLNSEGDVRLTYCVDKLGDDLEDNLN